MKTKEYVLLLADKKITATFTDMADQANGSVMLRSGDTAVFATAVMGKEDNNELDHFPLVVDYEEKFYASGRILGGSYMRREGRPSDEAILNGRIVDRTIRPLFDQNLRRDVQIIITVLSIDTENDPDVLAVTAASLALGVSNIPWNGPVSAVRIGKKKNNETFIINPTYTERDGAELDTLICGKDGAINMIEAGAYETSEKSMVHALEKATEALTAIEEFQKKSYERLEKKRRA